MSRKSFGLQQIDQKISDLLKPIFSGSKKEFALINNLSKNWQEIIGKKYAKFCYPKAVTFSKSKASQTKSAKLTIAAHNAAVGFFLENNIEMIIERIASFYGFKSINKIIIKQEPKDVAGNKNEEIHLPCEKENFLQNTISQIEDENLANTLKNLGKEILNQ